MTSIFAEDILTVTSPSSITRGKMRYKPGQTIDHYEIKEELGEGAYAETYKAYDKKTGRIVMLKSPNPLMFSDPQVYERFRRETQISKILDHPGVQRSLDLHDDHKEPYIVLEYIEGKNLRRKIQEFKDEIPIDTIINWGKQLADALKYIHSRGVIHRDLKPENILIDSGGTLKIVDFGTALVTGARRLTWRHLSESIGTPDYMSPEQIQGKRGGSRSDIYALGIMLYELLTGKVPFEGDNWLAVMAGHVKRNPKRIRKLRRDVSPALEAVVMKAMRRYPENRYQSADDLLKDIENLDKLDVSSFDLNPEKPMGGMSSAETPLQLFAYMALVALGFIIFVAVVILIFVMLRK